MCSLLSPLPLPASRDSAILLPHASGGNRPAAILYDQVPKDPPMTDYGHDLLFGAFLTPDAGRHDTLLAQASAAEDLGLELLTFQDHPYQPNFLDTWTLLSFLASRTGRIRLVPNVANVPLRPPAVLARSAAALDILTGGRVELGLGAGYFFDAIRSMGGPRRTPGESVDALDEAITVIRSLWTPGPPVYFEGRHYRLDGVRPGPPPPHDIAIWLGAYQRRMLELTGRVADGWVPTLAYAAPNELGPMTRTIDAAAGDTGRNPAAIRRIYNVTGAFTRQARGFLQGPPAMWAEQLSELVFEHGMSAFILGPGSEPVGDLQRFAHEVAPAVRAAVDSERRRGGPLRSSAGSGAASVTAPAGDNDFGQADGDGAQDGMAPPAEDSAITAAGREGQQMLLAVHAHLRQELQQLLTVMRDVAEGRTTAGAARSHLGDMTMRQNYWTLGAFCAAYCRVVATHHAIEDARMFPDLRAADASLGDVIDRLGAEHEVIAGIIDDIDAALAAMVADESRLDDAQQVVDRLAEVLLAHLDYEETKLLGPIGRLSIPV